jgi:pyruvate/2-oxoglutarate/acetoin dehydrogenase E1 component
MFVDFVLVAMDQICNQAAKLKYMSGGQVEVPLIVRSNIGTRGGAAAQHSQSLHATFLHYPD